LPPARHPGICWQSSLLSKWIARVARTLAGGGSTRTDPASQVQQGDGAVGQTRKRMFGGEIRGMRESELDNWKTGRRLNGRCDGWRARHLLPNGELLKGARGGRGAADYKKSVLRGYPGEADREKAGEEDVPWPWMLSRAAGIGLGQRQDADARGRGRDDRNTRTFRKSFRDTPPPLISRPDVRRSLHAPTSTAEKHSQIALAIMFVSAGLMDLLLRMHRGVFEPFLERGDTGCSSFSGRSSGFSPWVARIFER